MLDSFFLTVNSWMYTNSALAALGCLLWGVISVLFSPCHLASIPLMVGYVAGQGKILVGKQAAGYALLFSLGLFISIAIVGFICTLLGRMLGDISPLWGIPIGLVCIVLGLSLAGVKACSLPSGHIGRFQMKGHSGAFLLGLGYGLLSGTCTFGFIAPILAMVTVQGEVVKGMTLISFFALGHCLPIMLAGCSAAFAQRILAGKGMQSASLWVRRLAGGLVALVGLYFLAYPFI